MSQFRKVKSGFVSDLNSTTSAIISGGSWEGTWEDVSDYETVTIAPKTDQNGYFEVQFSPDGINQDSTLTKQYRTNQIEPPHIYTATRNYCRLAFYNTSATSQSFLRLQTTFGSKPPLNVPLDSTMAQDYDSTSVRPTDYHTEVALGRRQGATTVNKFGYNDDSDATPELLASWGGTFQYLTVGETITISTDNAQDTNTTGTGAWGLVIYGIDENWDEQVGVEFMTGLTDVVTTTKWIGINRISLYNSGSTDSNVGTIDIVATLSGFQMAQMPPANGTSQQLMYYVPQKHQLLATWMYLHALRIGGGGSPIIEFKAYVYSAVSDSIYEVYRDELDTSLGLHIDVKPSEPFIVGEKSIFWIEAESDTANTKTKGRFSGKLIRDVNG